MDGLGCNYLPVFVGRQTIFDASMAVWGHELLFRAGGHDQTALIHDSEQATASVITEGFSLATAMIPKNRKVLINYTKELLLSGAPMALPSDQCIVEVLEDVPPSPDVVASLIKLKELGYSIALDDYIGKPEYQPLLELADIVKVDVLGLSWREIIKLGQQLVRYSCRLLAEKVETRDVYDLTLALGFSYFQGFFFSRPEILTGRTIPTTAVNKIRLVHEMSTTEFDMAKVGQIISQDAGLSFRLLRHINSAYYSLSSKVKKISQVVALMGENALRKWLVLSMIAEVGSGGKAQELIFSSVHRARFLEMLATDNKQQALEPDVMFLLGLFSNLDALLNLPMEEVLDHLPLEKEISAALQGEPNRFRDWLELSISVENGDWVALQSKLSMLRLNESEVAVKHLHSAAWASRMLGLQEHEEDN